MRLARLFRAVILAAFALPAAALDVQQVQCTCADDARDHGDYVACVAQLSHRLVSAGDLHPSERARLLRDAARSRVPDVPLDIACETGGGGLTSYGVGLQAESQAFDEGATARVEALLWNFTADDVTGLSGRGGGDECLFDLEIEDTVGLVVHRRSVGCPAVVTEYPLESGRVRRLAIDVDLRHHLSDVPGVEGLALPRGEYILVLRSIARYPSRTFAFDGLEPEARLLVTVGDVP